jgi:hypothetical protein
LWHSLPSGLGCFLGRGERASSPLLHHLSSACIVRIRFAYLRAMPSAAASMLVWAGWLEKKPQQQTNAKKKQKNWSADGGRLPPPLPLHDALLLLRWGGGGSVAPNRRGRQPLRCSLVETRVACLAHAFPRSASSSDCDRRLQKRASPTSPRPLLQGTNSHFPRSLAPSLPSPHRFAHFVARMIRCGKCADCAEGGGVGGCGCCAFRAAVGGGGDVGMWGCGDKRAGGGGKWRRGKPTCFCSHKPSSQRKRRLVFRLLFLLPPLVLSSSHPLPPHPPSAARDKTLKSLTPSRCRIGLPILLRG